MFLSLNLFSKISLSWERTLTWRRSVQPTQKSPSCPHWGSSDLILSLCHTAEIQIYVLCHQREWVRHRVGWTLRCAPPITTSLALHWQLIKHFMWLTSLGTPHPLRPHEWTRCSDFRMQLQSGILRYFFCAFAIRLICLCWQWSRDPSFTLWINRLVLCCWNAPD